MQLCPRLLLWNEYGTVPFRLLLWVGINGLPVLVQFYFGLGAALLRLRLWLRLLLLPERDRSSYNPSRPVTEIPVPDRLHTLAFLLSATVPIVTGVIQNIKNNDRAIFLFIDENSRIRIRIRYSEVRIREYGSVPNVRFRIRNNACYTIKQFLHFHSKRCYMFENFPKRKCPEYSIII